MLVSTTAWLGLSLLRPTSLVTVSAAASASKPIAVAFIAPTRAVSKPTRLPLTSSVAAIAAVAAAASLLALSAASAPAYTAGPGAVATLFRNVACLTAVVAESLVVSTIALLRVDLGCVEVHAVYVHRVNVLCFAALVAVVLVEIAAPFT